MCGMAMGKKRSRKARKQARRAAAAAGTPFPPPGKAKVSLEQPSLPMPRHSSAMTPVHARNQHGRISAHKFFEKNYDPAENNRPKGPPPPPPICASEIRQGLDPVTNACFKNELGQRLEPFMEKVHRGQFLCGVGKDELGGHQIVVREVARMLAAKPAVKKGDRRGLLVFHNTGSGKCHAYDTPILMRDGSIKKVQDVAVGDVLMGDDGGARTVGSLARGEETMFDIVPSNGETWGCNESHILVLEYVHHKQIARTPLGTWSVSYRDGNWFESRHFATEDAAISFATTIPDDLSIVEIELRDYLVLPRALRRLLKMFRAGGVDFVPAQEPCLDVDEAYAAGLGLGLGDHTIPDRMKTGSRAVRLHVLAGVLDAEGSVVGDCYEISRRDIGDETGIVFVARSLGFVATLVDTALVISGSGLGEIPVKIESKMVKDQKVKNALHYGFDVVPKGWGDYYGFTIDGNRRYLLGDFTVTHNTVTAMGIMTEFWKSPKKIVFCTTLKNMKDNDTAEYARNALIFFPEKAELVFGAALASLKTPRARWTIAESKNTESEFVKWCANAGSEAIKKKVVFHSFWTLGSQQRSSGKMTDEILKNDGKGSVLIMDEAQNMFHTKDKREESACKYLREYLQRDGTLGHVVCFPLTATPGDTAEEYAEMLNVVRPVGTEKLTVRDIVRTPHIARGLVSYADIRGDHTHYGEISDGVSKGPRDISIPHDPRYFAAMLASFRGPTWSKEVRDLDKHPGASKRYFVSTLAGGCALPATAVRGFYDAAQLEKLREQHLFVRVNNSQMLLSDKMRVAMERAMATPGCQYIYVPDAKVLKAVVSSFKGLGLSQAKVSTHTEETANGPRVTITQAKPRFYAFHDGTLDSEKPTDKQMKAMLNFFKSSQNKNGDYLKIFVGTVYEGLDMSWLRGVHLCAPLPTKPDDDQAVGRALRYCGHSANARTVAVYRYLGMAPRNLETDDLPAAKQKAVETALKDLVKYDPRGFNAYVREDSERRAKPLSEFIGCIQAQAVDCGLLDSIQFGRKVTCGNPVCDVKLDQAGRLVPLPKPNYGANAMKQGVVHANRRQPTGHIHNHHVNGHIHNHHVNGHIHNHHVNGHIHNHVNGHHNGLNTGHSMIVVPHGHSPPPGARPFVPPPGHTMQFSPGYVHKGPVQLWSIPTHLLHTPAPPATPATHSPLPIHPVTPHARNFKNVFGGLHHHR